MSQTTEKRGCARWFVREGRLRSGWRVMLYLAARWTLSLLAAVVLGLLVAAAIGIQFWRAGTPPAEINERVLTLYGDWARQPFYLLAVQAVEMGVLLLVLWFFRRLVDKRSFRSLGFQTTRGWWQEGVGGFFFSLGAWSIIFLASLTLGAVVIEDLVFEVENTLTTLGALALWFIVNVFVGFSEETDARGYMLQNLAEGIRFFPAAFVSSLYFGVLHLLNPGAGIGSTLGIFFAGIALAMGYYVTGRLWFPIGMHAGWNFAEGPIFGFLVSGLNMGGLFRLRITGPDWLMGGAFGPEAGALAVAVEIAMIGILFVWAKQRGKTRGRTV